MMIMAGHWFPARTRRSLQVLQQTSGDSELRVNLQGETERMGDGASWQQWQSLRFALGSQLQRQFESMKSERQKSSNRWLLGTRLNILRCPRSPGGLDSGPSASQWWLRGWHVQTPGEQSRAEVGAPASATLNSQPDVWLTMEYPYTWIFFSWASCLILPPPIHSQSRSPLLSSSSETLS